MFTGIIEEKGKILQIDYISRQATRLKIEAPTILEDAHIGDSIAINGVCLTVTKQTETAFDVDIMPETIQATSLQSLQIRDSITINGVYLTFTRLSESTSVVDIMPDTIQASSLLCLLFGSVVNLERATPANGRFGGHFVSGHVDATGRLIRKTPKENS